MHAYIHTITLHYITLTLILTLTFTLQYITIHYNTLQYIAIHCNTLQYIAIQTYMHTCMHACIHTYIYIHTYIHTCMHTYIHTDIQTYRHTVYMHTSIHPSIHPSIHTCIYIYIIHIQAHIIWILGEKVLCLKFSCSDWGETTKFSWGPWAGSMARIWAQNPHFAMICHGGPVDQHLFWEGIGLSKSKWSSWLLLGPRILFGQKMRSFSSQNCCFIPTFFSVKIRTGVDCTSTFL